MWQIDRMKIQLTSKKQASEMKAASLKPEREMEEDAIWPTEAEEVAEAATKERAPKDLADPTPITE